MRLLATGNSRKFAVVALVSAASALIQTDRAGAQYYYQPAPDYYHNDTASGTVAGGALGAVSGAIIGGKKNRGEGALIGLGVGALTGNLLGRSKDRADEARTAYGAAAVGQMNAQANSAAVTNYDLLEMTRAGVSEDVIISTMRSRGTRIDLAPQSLIALKQQGISDRVVMAAQDMQRGYPPAGPAPVAVVREVPPPPAVIVERPYYYYPRYGYYHHHHHYRHCGPHTHVHFGF
jgi:uncharacterized protein YcfJ